MHAVEKILARAGGVATASAGDIVEARVDVAMLNERQGPRVADSFREHGFHRVRIPEKVVVVFDHCVSPTRAEAATKQKAFREFLAEHSISAGYSVGEGVEHQVLLDGGHALPGEVLVGTDSHTVTSGACGGAATGIGQTEMVAVLVTGQLWLRVPEFVRVDFSGTLPPGVMAKDVVLEMIRLLGTRGALYRGLEFAGPAIGSLSMDDRATLCNASVEVGAKFGFVEPDDVTLAYLKGRARRAFTPEHTDPDYQYAEVHRIDLSAIEPLVALPHNVDRGVPVARAAGTPIDQAVIGSCAGGRLTDLRAAAAVLRGRKVHPRVRMIVTPGSREIYLRALEEGVLATLVEAGASVNPPRCGPCGSSMDGVLAPGERAVINTTRNFRGRMGPDAELYLASAATVAASAVEGAIADPRAYLQ